MKETYIRFMAPVHPLSTASLFQILDNKLKEKYERIHLMISSPGGSVFHGISIYNFLRGAPFEVYTYNFGSGAGDEDRTRDPLLGKQMLYH